MLDGPELRVFAQVGRTLSFASAARALGLTPSAVSKAVARLEQRLGAKLLVRTTRSVRLTETGALLLERVAPLLRALDDAERVALAGRELEDGSLVEVLPALSSVGPPIWLLCAPGQQVLPKFRALADFLSEVFGSASAN